MADSKISALPSGAPAQGGDEYVVARSGANYKLSLTNIAADMPDTTIKGSLVVNEDGADKDTRIEGDTDANLFFVDASTDRIGVSTATPSEKVDIASGNMVFSGTAQRIKADFGGDWATRLIFQSKTTNGETRVTAMPNGSSQIASFSLSNSSTPTNSVTASLRADSTAVSVSANSEGSATPLPLEFRTTNTAGTPGSTRMHISTAGDVGINTTSPDAKLSVNGVASFGAGAAALPSVAGFGDLDTGMWFPAANTLAWSTGGSERMHIDSSGRVGIGGTAQASDKTNITGTFPASAGASIGCNVNGTIPSSATLFGFSYQSNTSVENASFTLGSWAHFAAYPGAIGASATVTNQFGVYIDSSLTGATNNYGLYSNIASGSNRWNFYAAGTAQNYFAGNVLVGTTTAAAGGLLTLNRAPAAAFGTPMLQVGGASFTSGGYYSVGLGFTDATYTEPPGEIALVTTSDSGGTKGAIAFGTRDVTTNTAVTERMRIDSSGNVGIGTASPDAKLTVSGAASFSDGTASAPGIANTGDLDTGVYFPAANEMAVTTGGTVAAAFNSNGLFFRNRIINGDMRIDQRNAGAAVTHSGSADLYVLDRWVCNSTGTPQFSVQQVTDAPTGFVNSSKLTTTTSGTPAAGDFSYYRQYIEGTNIADLGWGAAGALTITLSFWVKSSLTGTFGGALTNNAGNRFYVFSYVINSANTWEYKTVTISGDTTGTWLTTTGRGITVSWDTGSGSTNKTTAGSWGTTVAVGVTGGVNLVATASATWQITGVQLETGSVATPFERRPYGEMLMLCQRYCQKLAGDTAYTVVADGWQSSTTSGVFTYSFGNPMRASPTLTTGTVGDFYARNGSITSNLSTLTLDTGVNATKESVSFIATWAGAGGAAGYGTQLVSGANAPKVILSAEL
jgi:hypothetical protein